MRPVVLIGGIAQGLGLAQASLFAENGFDVLGLARSDRAAAAAAAAVASAGGEYRHVRCDLGCAEQVGQAVDPLADRISVAIHNAHHLLIRPFLESGAEMFEQVWRSGCLSAAVTASAVLPGMLAKGGGTLLFTGATAGLRGGANFAAFASAKFALRGLAQSLAREFGPQGVHVAHIVIDGLIEAAQTDERFGASDQPNARLDPAAAAQTYLHLARQPKTVWTHELDLRPFAERF